MNTYIRIDKSIDSFKAMQKNSKSKLTLWKALKYYCNFFENQLITRSGLIYFLEKTLEKNKDHFSNSMDTLRLQLTEVGYLDHISNGTYCVNRKIPLELTSSELRRIYSLSISEKRIECQSKNSQHF